MNTIFDRLKSTEGRLSRQGYLLGFIAPVLAMAALTAAMIVGWLDFLPIGVIRMIAYASGQVDHTPGMRGLALATLGTGVVAAVAMVALTIAVVTT